MKYLIYARVSPKGSSWSSAESTIDMQIKQCERYIRNCSGEVSRIVKDEFFTAKDKKRPGLQEILSDLAGGLAEWDAIIVYRLDRLTRSLRDGGEIFDAIRSAGKGFISVTENLDLSTPMGRAMLWIIHVFAQLEREQLGERTKDKMVSMASKGEFPGGVVPFGYSRPQKHKNVLEINPRESAIVKDIFKMYVSKNTSSVDICRKYQGQLTKNRILNILKNKHYIGMIKYDGKEYKGKHKAIISEDLFMKAQDKLPQKKNAPRPSKQKYNYLLTGLVKCHCGRNMTAKSAKGGKFHYYTCTDSVSCKAAVSAGKLEDAVLNKIKELHFNTETISEICKEVENKAKSFLDLRQPEKDELQQALATAKKEQNKIKKIFLSDKVTGDNMSFWNKELSKVNAEIQRLEGALSAMEGNSVDMGIFSDARALTEYLNSFLRLMEMNPDNYDTKRNAVLSHIEKIQRTPDGKFYFVPVLGTLNRMEWLPESVLSVLFSIAILKKGR